MRNEAIVALLLDRVRSDLETGRLRRLSDYQVQFPGYEDLVESVFTELKERAVAPPEPAPASPSDPPVVLPPLRHVGPFKLIREIGRGGQAEVYLAEDTRLHRQVALKMLRGLGAFAEDVLRRFEREAQIASQLRHPGICVVHEARVDDGVPYIAMQYVEGMTLAKRIATSRNRLTAKASGSDSSTLASENLSQPAGSSGCLDRAAILEAVAILERTARALHAAHEAGIIHRDVKPGNIMITPGGDPVILDFGLARDGESEASTITASGDLFGTPAYMSPEQLARHDVHLDRRTDVWSLGVTLFEVTTMRRPFEGPTRQSLFHAILMQATPDARRLNAAIPNDLKVVLDAALEKDLDRRYQTAEALADDLRAVLEHRPIAAKAIGPAGRFVRWAVREPAKATLLVTLLVALPVISALVALRIQDQPRLEAQRLAEVAQAKEDHLVRAFFAIGEHHADRAIPELEAALECDPASVEAVMGLALAFHFDQRPNEALRVLESNAPLVGARRDATLLRRAIAALPGQPHDLQDADLAPPQDALGHFLEGQRLWALGEAGGQEAFHGAHEAFTSAILCSPSLRLFFYVAAIDAASSVEDGKAVTRMAEALHAFWPDSALAHAARSRALYRIGEFDGAIEAAQHAIKLRPDFAPGYQDLGRALGMKGLPDDAIAAFHEAIRIEPDEVSHQCLGAELAKKGLFAEAATEYECALAISPRSALALTGLAICLQRQGSLEDAERRYQEAIAADPRLCDARLSYGCMLEPREALPHLRAAIELDPGEAKAYCALAGKLSQLGQLSEALDQAKHAVRLDPTFAQARGSLGRIAFEVGDLRLAESELRAAISLTPDRISFWSHLTEALEAARRFREALTAAERTLELPNDQLPPEMRELLERVAKDRVLKLKQRASDEARFEAIAVHGELPDDPAELPAVAELALRLGKAEQAANWYALALENKPGVAVDLLAGHRFRAACAAVLVGSGKGEGGVAIDVDAMTSWRRKALSWLREDLEDWRESMEAAPSRKWHARQALCAWTSDPSLEPVREPAAQDRLAPDEREHWIVLFAQAAALQRSLR